MDLDTLEQERKKEKDTLLTEYVIYARRSRDEKSEKQVASIPQQIEECHKYAKKEGLQLALRPNSYPVKQIDIKEIEDDNQGDTERSKRLIAFYTEFWVITERGSAKEPFTRKGWRKIIDLVDKKEIKGLLAYSPDRISRNTQEGGELINKVDNIEIGLKLKFSNFHFENNAAGHMMLGFWFVFAEHYVKKLREDVIRSTSKKHTIGLACSSRKYGYKVNDDDRFVIDEFHFPILQNAFKRKIKDGWSDKKIADEMNENGWHQKLKKDTNPKMTAQKLSNKGKKGYNVWGDTFYYGVHTKAFKGRKVIADLRDLEIPGYKFKPLISEKDWLFLQELMIDRTHASIVKKESLRTKRLDPAKPTPNGFIVCKSCKRAMSYALPNKKRFDAKMKKEGKTLDQIVKPHQIRYRCSNSKCKAYGLELTWDKVASEIAKEFKKIRVSEEDFQAYLYAKTNELQRLHAERNHDMDSVGLLLNKTKSEHDKFLKDTHFGQGLSGKERKLWRKEIENFEQRTENLEEKKKALRKDVKDEILEKQAFTEMIMNLSEEWKKGNYVQKRELLENLCLNILINSKKQLEINIKPELADMFIQDGGPGRI